MKDDQKVLNYLAQLKDRVEKITMTLPEDFSGRVYVRRHSVDLDLQGPRLGVFTLVLGGEAPGLFTMSNMSDSGRFPKGWRRSLNLRKKPLTTLPLLSSAQNR